MKELDNNIEGKIILFQYIKQKSIQGKKKKKKRTVSFSFSAAKGIREH